VLHPLYLGTRSDVLSQRPAPDGLPGSAHPFGPLFGIVVDAALDSCLVSLFLLADGTITIYNSDGIHSTGLRGAPKVVEAAAAIFGEVRARLHEFAPVEDLSMLPLPEPGGSQILVRTYEGDFAASDRLNSKHEMVAELVAMALIVTQVARMSLVEGFDRVEAGEVRYRLDPEYRRLRSTLMSWLPEAIPEAARIVSVAVEIGEEQTETVTSLFAFVDGSTSVYRSDGTLAEGLSGLPGVGDAARALLQSIEAALTAFTPAELVALPQPGRVQFVARARSRDDGIWTELLAVASQAGLADSSHPLAASFARASEVLRIAG